MSDKKEVELISRCCDAPVYWVYEGGPVCRKCKKWATTKEKPREVIRK